MLHGKLVSTLARVLDQTVEAFSFLLCLLYSPAASLGAMCILVRPAAVRHGVLQGQKDYTITRLTPAL